MAQEIQHDLGLKQEQKQILTPAQLQSLELLTMNAQELDGFIEQQLLENPVLEPAGEEEQAAAAAERAPLPEPPRRPEKESNEWDDSPYAEEIYEGYSGFTISGEAYGGAYGGDVAANERSAALAHYDNDLPRYLLLQLPTKHCSPQLSRALNALVYSLDNDGYLRVSLDEIAADLQTSVSVVERALGMVQSLEPAGVGARSLAECLRLQVPRQHPERELVLTIIDSYLTELATGHFKAVARRLGVGENKVRQIFDYVRTFEPRPAQSPARQEQPQYVVADIIVRQGENGWLVSLAESRRASLRVSPYYREMLEQGIDNEEARNYVRQKLGSAAQLIRNIARRRQTVLKVARLIVRHQEGFLLHGLAQLRPLTLREIAEEAELHESTVCRAVGGKYMDTPRGVYPVRFFFSRAYVAADGQEFSGAYVRTMIAELISHEDKASPLSDRQIEDALAEQGLNVARRTVAKYRDEMGLPKKSFRRR